MFANLTDLKAAVADWLNRDDLPDTRLTQFVRLGEEQFNLFLRGRYNRKTTRVYLDPGSVLSIPSDYIEIDTLRPVGAWEGDPPAVTTAYRPPLVPVSYQSIAGYPESSGEDAPANFAEYPDGTAWVLYPATQWALDLTYYARLVPVTDTETNAVFTQEPGMYLAAAMVEAENFLKLADAERGPWRDKLAAFISAQNGNLRRTQLSGGTLSTRAPYR